MRIEDYSRVFLIMSVVCFGLFQLSDFAFAQQQEPIGILIPLYTYPDPTWDSVIDEKFNHPNVPIIAIINPNNGPSSTFDPNYAAGIQNLRSSGVVVLGYVHTSWGDRSESEVMDDIQTYVNWYDLDGIFFDEMSSVPGDEFYYSSLDNYVKSLGLSLTIGNPGTDISDSYVGTVDNIIVYENSQVPLSNFFDGWHSNYHVSNFSFLAYDVSDINQILIDSYVNKISYLYITDDSLSNPWDSLPSYFTQLVQYADVDIDVPLSIWQPVPGTTWNWQLTGTLDLSYDVEMYDIDLFDSTKDNVDHIKSQNSKAVCYISAGSWETWRPDADQFPEYVLGASNGWPGERWLDIRQIDVIGPIMEQRLDFCAEKGFDGVEPDNVDAYSNNSGFPLTYEDQLQYNIWLANEAHKRGLSVGLKNNLGQVNDLVDYFDWAINEQCFVYDECDLLTPFIEQNKAVFQAEYIEDGTILDQFCLESQQHNFSGILKTLDLSSWYDSCESINVNNAPIAVDDHMETTSDLSIIIDVLENDIDNENDLLSLNSVTSPVHGSILLNSDNTITYVPSLGFSGIDSFDYVVADNNGGLDTGIVTVSVSVTPLTSAELTVVSQWINGTEFSGMWTEIYDDSVLIFDGYTPVSYLADIDKKYLVISSNWNQINFDHWDDGDFPQERTISITQDTTLTANYKFENVMNNDPVAINDFFSLNEDGFLQSDVMLNDFDVDGDSLIISSVSQAQYGLVVLIHNNLISYTPNPNFHGTDSFEYVIDDGNGGTSIATVVITVNPINDPPVASNDVFTLEGSQMLNVLINDSDDSDDLLTIVSISVPNNGIAEIINGTLIKYNPNLEGIDVFTYNISDSEGLISTAQITVNINNLVNDQTHTLTVNTSDFRNQEITGLWTEIWDGEMIVAEGFSPLSINLEDGKTYSIHVDNYKKYKFGYWEDNSNANPRLIIITSDTELTAYYKVPVTLTVTSKGLDDVLLPGLWTELIKNDSVIAQGYTEKKFSVSSDTSYRVYVSDYQNLVFDHWEDGGVDRYRSIFPSENVSLVAYYSQ